MAITFFNWIKTTLANIAGADVADADEFVLIDQDGDGASPPGPASKAITRAELSKALVVQEELAESPITPDNTVSEYVFDVRDYVKVVISIEEIGFASSDVPEIVVSIDNDVSYKEGASDYRLNGLTSGAEFNANVDEIQIDDGAATSGHTAVVVLDNLRAGRLIYDSRAAQGGSSSKNTFGFANFAGPITHIKVKSDGGANISATGTIRAVGIRGSAV